MTTSWMRKCRFRGLVSRLTVLGLLTSLVLPPVISYGVVTPAVNIPKEGFAAAERAPLVVSVDAIGELESSQNALLTSQCEWTSPLLWKIEDGTRVNKGDVIARLDTSELEQRARAREVLLLQAMTQLQRAESDLEIQQLTNESRLADAQLQAELTNLELDGYQNAQFPQQQHALERDVVLAREALLRAQKRLEYAERMVRLGYQDPQDSEKERLSVMRLEQSLASKQSEMDLMLQFGHQRKLKALTSAKEQARRELKRVESETRASVLNREIRVQAYRRVVASHESYLDRVRRSIAACTIRASQAGEVIFVRASSSSPETLKEGDEVRYLQEVAQLPDRSQVQVALRLHESRIRQVEAGQPVTITADAVRGETLSGEVIQVSSVPLRGRFPNYEQREYEVTVRVQARAELLEQLAPGLTANVRIIAAQVPQALKVPIRSIVTVGGQPYVFVRRGDGVESRSIVTGLANDQSIQIVEGLTPGEEVVLDPRGTCARQIQALQGTSLASAFDGLWDTLR